MKTIVIFCRNIAADKPPFNDQFYVDSYQDLLLLIKQHGAQAYFATDNATYLGKGVFSTTYTVDHKQPLAGFTKVSQVKADLVYEKGGFTGTDVPVLNPALVHRITSNKVETYKYFGQYMPVSVICQTRAEVEQAFREIPGEMIVVKEPEGNGGKYVQIGQKAQVLAEAPDRYPLLVQQFLDTSVGIPGMVEGVHELRINVGGGEIWGGKYRTPGPGELRVNVSQGGTEHYLFTEEIPETAIALAREIDESFKACPRYYCVDLANTPDGWKLVELNSKPGLTPAHIDDRTRFVLEKLAGYLVELADKP